LPQGQPIQEAQVISNLRQESFDFDDHSKQPVQQPAQGFYQPPVQQPTQGASVTQPGFQQAPQNPTIQQAPPVQQPVQNQPAPGTVVDQSQMFFNAGDFKFD
jgi:hypothetical protein